MQRSFSTALASIAAIASSLIVPDIVQAQTTYTLTQVDINNSSTFATGLNDQGDLALTVGTSVGTRTHLWRRGIETDIGGLTPSPQLVESGGINDQVQIVGTTISPTTGTFAAFVWQRGHMTELPTPAGSTAAFGIRINLLGQVVGQVFDANFNSQIAVWTRGKVTLLPNLPEGHNAQPSGVNIRGDIVGLGNDAANVGNAVLWKQGVPTVLVNNAIANGINDAGQIVGATAASTAFLWQNGATIQLPPLPGFAAVASAAGINDLGQIVGSSGGLAVLWQNRVPVNLTSQIDNDDPLQPFVQLQAARLINNLGQILASGTDSRNPFITHEYLLTPAH